MLKKIQKKNNNKYNNSNNNNNKGMKKKICKRCCTVCVSHNNYCVLTVYRRKNSLVPSVVRSFPLTLAHVSRRSTTLVSSKEVAELPCLSILESLFVNTPLPPRDFKDFDCEVAVFWGCCRCCCDSILSKLLLWWWWFIFDLFILFSSSLLFAKKNKRF